MVKIITIFGTRPEIIRLSCILKKLDTYSNHIMVHTGQNYDYELNSVFFNDLNLRKPDYFLGVKSDSLGEQLGKILIETEKVLEKEKPDAVIILGDTNSSISAIIAKRLRIIVYHLEAGNRCFDDRVPEEINRRLVDHISDINICYSENARNYLLKEGLKPERIFVMGSPMREVLLANMDNINSSTVLETLKLKTKSYFLISAHREENVDNYDKLQNLVNILYQINEKYGFDIIVSTHPRTKKMLQKFDIDITGSVQFLSPFGFHDYINLQKNAYCVISDSGTIFEEAAILNFPAVVIRDSTERPEALETGTCVQTILEIKNIIDSIIIVTETAINKNITSIPVDYQPTNVSDRVIRLVIGQTDIFRDKIWK